ncbi:hypothetical protein lerEdw1_009629 [Lerista edwardsae]|nr:hypothetical protein lerEdw1_009629 [Lerista edwardsae]
MQAVLGLVVFSVLLATGASLTCDVCTAQGKTCNQKVDCPGDADACMSVLTETKVGTTPMYSIVKTCTTKSLCTEKLDQVKSQLPGGMSMTVECSKAPPSAGSLLLALSGLLLLKILV